MEEEFGEEEFIERKLYGSSIVKVLSYFILFLLFLFSFDLSIQTINDQSINLADRIKTVIFVYIALVLPFILLAIKVTKYYVLVGKKHIEVNGLLNKKIIRYEDICEIKEDINIGYFGELEKSTGIVNGITIIYTQGKSIRKGSIYISASVKGFKKIYSHIKQYK